MKKIYFLIIILFLVLTFFSACSNNRDIVEVKYYILDYFPHLDKEELKQTVPFPYSVEITESQIPRSYQRNQIVSKNSINTISYSNEAVWADKLYNSIPQLLLQKANRYNFFDNAQRDFFTTLPDFYIDSFVASIEQVNVNERVSAHVKMDFYLRNAKQNIVVVHRSNRTEPVLDSDMSSIVQTFSVIISEEYDNFLMKSKDYFVNGIESKNLIPELNADKLDNIDDFEKLAADDYEETTGELLVPNLSTSTTAPKVFIRSTETESDYEIDMGEVITLPVGKYTLYLGRGQETEIIHPIEVKPKYRTIVTPTWSSLTINIIDSGKTKVRMAYDIFKGNSNEPLGSAFSAADEAGEENRVWILKPDLYFITVDGASFSSYIDFTTITLESGKHYNLTMVVDPDGANGKLLGAGIHPQETEALLNESNWNTQNAFHLNFNINANNETEEDSFDENITLSSQLDTRIKYEKDNLNYDGRVNWELGFNKESDQDLKISVDDFRINNTVIYNIWNNIGFYGRLDANSHFLPKRQYFTSETDYLVYNQHGSLIDSLLNKDDITLQDPLFPLTLKEDIGLNWRVGLNRYGNVNFRAGLGWLQTYNNEVLVFDRTDANGFNIYRQIPDTSTRGIATSIVGNFNIPQIRLSWSSTADLLVPLQGDGDPTFEFINVFNLKLIRNVSWDVRFDVNYDKNYRDYFVYKTSSFIRLSYFF